MRHETFAHSIARKSEGMTASTAENKVAGGKAGSLEACGHADQAAILSVEERRAAERGLDIVTCGAFLVEAWNVLTYSAEIDGSRGGERGQDVIISVRRLRKNTS